MNPTTRSSIHALVAAFLAIACIIAPVASAEPVESAWQAMVRENPNLAETLLQEVDKYVADPLCGFAVSTQTWIDMLRALDRISNPRNVAKVPKGKPLYLMAGDQDPVGDFGKGVKRLHEAWPNGTRPKAAHRRCCRTKSLRILSFFPSPIAMTMSASAAHEKS